MTSFPETHKLFSAAAAGERGGATSEQSLDKVLDNILVQHGSRSLPTPDPTLASGLAPADRWVAALKPVYTLFGKIGQGGQATVYRARRTVSTNPAAASCEASHQFVAIKVYDRYRLLNRDSSTRLKHFAVELSCLRVLPRHPSVNHTIAASEGPDLLHSSCGKIFVVLNYVGPSAKPSVETRLAHFLCVRKPSKLPMFDSVLSSWRAAADKANVFAAADDAHDSNLLALREHLFGEFVDEQRLFAKLAVECGVSNTKKNASAGGSGAAATEREVPVSGTLHDFVVAQKRLHYTFANSSIKQSLGGLFHLHKQSVVHRDVKPANVLISVQRHLVELKRDGENDNKVCGAVFEERLGAVVSDMGLSKYLFEQWPGAAPAAASGAEGGAKEHDGGGGDDDHADEDDEEQKNPSEDVFAGAAAAAAAYDDDAVQSVMSLDQSRQKAAAAAAATSAAAMNSQQQQQQQQQQGATAGAGATTPFSGNSTISPFRNVTVMMTPVGTSLFLSLEAARGVLSAFAGGGGGGAGGGSAAPRWVSTNGNVRKIDAHGAGIIAFWCYIGAPTIDLSNVTKSYRPVSREQQLAEIEKKLLAGPVFPQFVSRVAREFISKLLNNNVEERLTVKEALEHPFMRDVPAGPIIRSEYGVGGVVSIKYAQEASSFASAAASAASEASNKAAAATAAAKSSSSSSSGLAASSGFLSGVSLSSSSGNLTAKPKHLSGKNRFDDPDEEAKCLSMLLEHRRIKEDEE